MIRKNSIQLLPISITVDRLLPIPPPPSFSFPSSQPFRRFILHFHSFFLEFLSILFPSVTLTSPLPSPQLRRLMDSSRDTGGRVFRNRERMSYAPYQKDRRNFRQNSLCKNCKRPGHFARECLNDSVCTNCGQAGHMAADCNSKTMCWNCKEPGLSTECNNLPICHSCGKMGHLARDCPKSSDPRICSNCFHPGHMAGDCINEKACNKCRKPGHLVRDCLSEPICNVCYLTGHVALHCPNSAPPPFPPPPMLGLPHMAVLPFHDIFCRSCGYPGHTTHQCMYMIICSGCGGRGHRAFECPSGPMLDMVYR